MSVECRDTARAEALAAGWEVGDALRVLHDRGELTQHLRNALGTSRPFPECVQISAEEAYMIDRVRDRRVRAEVVTRECEKACAQTECLEGIDSIARRRAIEYAARLQQSMQALDRLIAAVAPLDGAKHLVLITGGNYLSPLDQSAIATIGERAALGRIYVHALQVWNPPGVTSPELRSPATDPNNTQSASAEVALAAMTGGVAITTLGGDGARQGQGTGHWPRRGHQA